MKIKYLRLSKEERKKARNLYYETPKGKALKSKLRLVLISSIGLLLCSIGILSEAYLTNAKAWDYAYGICLLIFSIFFIISYYRLRIQRLNEYVVNNKPKL